MKTGLKIMSLFLLLTGTAQAQQVLSAENVKCGGYLSMNKDAAGNISLFFQRVGSNSQCMNIKIPSQQIDQRLDGGDTTIALNKKNLGSVLPVMVDSDLVILKYSLDQVNAPSQMAQEKQQRDQEAQARHQQNANAAKAVGATAAVSAAAGAVVIKSATSQER